jgi:hypothetical protein
MDLRLGLLLSLFLAGTAAQAAPSYYSIADHDKAQAEARQRNLPLAWVGGIPSDLTVSLPQPGSDADLEQLIMDTLEGSAVIIFFDATHMGPVPGIVHAQFHISDDGPLGGGAAWLIPKIVFTNPEVTKTLGRVSHTQLAADRAAPLKAVLQSIHADPTALTPPAPSPEVAAAATTTDTDSGQPATTGGSFPGGLTVAGIVNQYGFFLFLGFIVLLAGFACLGGSSS